MNEIIALSLQAMQADATRVREVGVNLSNALTAGYKRSVVVHGPQSIEFPRLMETAVHSERPDGPVALRVDERAGTLRATGQSLDVALAGRGYFEVMTESGHAYTRNGSFRLDAAGRLVTAQGHAVMGQSGEIRPPSDRLVISASGAISAQGGDSAAAPIDQLRIVDFKSDAGLERRPDGLLASRRRLAPTDVSGVMRQGYLENANVDTGKEMTTLMEAVRHFESMQKVVQSLDDMVGTAVRKLGENP